MKVLRGMEKLGKFEGIDLFIDWNYLRQARGARKELDDLQKVLGSFLLLASVLALFTVIIFELLNGSFIFISALNPTNFVHLIFWVAAFTFAYSLYLTRDRTKFFDTLEIKQLDYLRHKIKDKKDPSEIEIADYFDYDILNIFDDLIREDDNQFFYNLFFRLVELKNVKEVLKRLGITADQLRKIYKNIELNINPTRDQHLHKTLFGSFVLAVNSGFASVDERVVFIYICQNQLKDILIEQKVLPQEIEGILIWSQNEAKKLFYSKLWRERASLKPKNTVNRSFTSRLAKTLEQFKRDFTLEVIQGDFTLSIARGVELDEMVRFLHQGDKGAVLVIGEPGVGKTTLIKSLALRMVVEDVPKELADMRLVGFNFNRAYALAGSIDGFRKVLETVFQEVSNAKNIILVLDNVDQLINIRDEVAAEVVNILVDAIDRLKLRVLATTTVSGYNSVIKIHKALVSLFDTITINEPSDSVSLQILIDEVKEIEARYKISISLDALKKAVELSHKYAFDRTLPEKGIDLVEEAASFSVDSNLSFVSESQVEQLVSKKVGVNVGSLNEEERTKLANLEKIMHQRVIGQDFAIKAIAGALRRARAGLSTGKRPVASFLFFGPTGVGKTEVAKTLAHTYYGDEKMMIRLDMSEYHEEENLKRLIGYQEGNEFHGGYLTEKVREKPFSLILLDELEKANPKVLDIFLQVLDEGSMTDGIGRRVDFTNTIIVATSNAGSYEIAENIEKNLEYKQVYKNVIPELRQVFRVEFLNRFDAVIMFKPLTQSEIEKIADLMLKKTGKTLYDKGIKLNYSPQVLRELAQIGYNPVNGAREMRRVIQEMVEDKIAELIVAGKLKEGGTLMINSFNNFQIVG